MTEYFPEVKKPVRYEGPDSRNPLAFRYYDPGRIVRGKSMAEHLKFSVAYWHAFGGTGMDPFGAPTFKILKDGVLNKPLEERYAGYRKGMGKKILQGKTSLPELEDYAAEHGEPRRTSGRQEAMENILNDYLYNSRIE